MNKYNFNGRVAVITGGAQGFGLAITKRIIQSNGNVIIWDIDKDAISKAKNEIKSFFIKNSKKFMFYLLGFFKLSKGKKFYSWNFLSSRP